MGATVTGTPCHWRNCDQQPVAWAVYGAIPDHIGDGAYCTEHFQVIQEAFSGNNLSISTENGWVTATDMLTQDIP